MLARTLNTLTVIVAAIGLCFPGPTAAWDGSVTGKIVQVDVTDAGSLGFRVYVGSVGAHCAGGPGWAYLNEGDSNYKTYVAVLMMAKAQNSSVTIYSNNAGGYCHIGYIQIGV